MRNIFKTSYRQDIKLFEHNGHYFWYGLLLLFVFAAPLFLSPFRLGEAPLIFIYAIAGIGLMLLTGFTGLASLGHAAFLGVGAYAHNFLFSKLGVPLPVSLLAAAGISAAFGIAFAIPVLRMTGIYLAIATLAFLVLMEQLFSHWIPVTGGFRGLNVPKPDLFGWKLDSPTHFYYLCLVVLILVTLGARNVLRSPTGRAMIAVRDSEISAQSMGINIARTKVVAFGLSTGITGIAGALYAHYLNRVTPEAFDIILSIQLLLMIVVGGLGSLHGCFYGAIVLVELPQLISRLKDLLNSAGSPLLSKIANMPGLTAGIFGLILCGFILFEPLGLYGRWRKIRLYFEIFPFYRKATFKRQRGYLKTERFR